VLRATVTDDGRGFDRTTQAPGVGLQGMDERALLAGGELAVTSVPGKGTAVRLVVPLAVPSTARTG
jgi:signal transduction histidine kinase